jgi:hypothetical protein
MPDGFYLISYVGGGTLGFLICGLIFFPLEETIAFSLMLFSLIYLTGGTIGFLLWDLIE